MLFSRGALDVARDRGRLDQPRGAAAFRARYGASAGGFFEERLAAFVLLCVAAADDQSALRLRFRSNRDSFTFGNFGFGSNAFG